MNAKEAWDVIKGATWERPDGLAPLVTSSDPKLTEDVMKSAGYKPGDDLFFELTNEGFEAAGVSQARRYSKWPSEEFSQKIPSRGLEWQVFGQDSLDTLAKSGASFSKPSALFF